MQAYGNVLGEDAMTMILSPDMSFWNFLIIPKVQIKSYVEIKKKFFFLLYF